MKIKTVPEDFEVIEINPRILSEGKYPVYLLKKRNLSTDEAARIIERKFNCKIKYSGTKDKRALTEQFVSSNKVIPELKEEKFTLTKAGFSDEPLSLGMHEGNKFRIRVDKKIDLATELWFPNYFGEQRFGTKNVEIAEKLLEKDWKSAAELLEDKRVNEHLLEKANDYLGAIKLLSTKILRLILASYQSHEFNKKLSEQLSGTKILVAKQSLVFPEKIEDTNLVIDLIGWDNGDRRFLFPQYPELSLEGDERNAFVLAKNIHYEKDFLCFDLPKGSYATIFLRQAFKEELSE